MGHPRSMDGSTRPQRYDRSRRRGGLRSVAPTDITDGPKLLDRMDEALRTRPYSPRTAEAYRAWAKRFVYFHGVRHPAEMGELEINAFLTHLAVNEKVSASTQNRALSPLLLLYRCVLDREVGDLGDVIRARYNRRLPVVLTREESRAVLDRLAGDRRLIVSLLYGSGLRLMECLQLRVKDLEFARGELTVRDGKGGKDRITMLPDSISVSLRGHLQVVKRLHESDLAAGWGHVVLPTHSTASIGTRPPNGAAMGFSARAPLEESKDGPGGPSPRT